MQILKHNDLKKAAEIIINGGVIIYPTDTIWGIGCDADNLDAVKRVIKMKGKREDANLIRLYPNIKSIGKELTALEKKYLNKKRTSVIIGGTAIRVIKTGWINKLLKHCKCPLVSTSANFHGQLPVQSWRQSLKLKPDAVIKGRKIYSNRPSKLIKIVNDKIEVLRE
ncbi:MAG: Sua5/YciO/YrdC/YwlC family protein [Christensenellaceae bacterium]|jgi:L-threonylcarbamoyladenylate synthase|nr:Sua5/YciO/YrdC/YwlC family protein [Christensenellaceae bacterium]